MTRKFNMHHVFGFIAGLGINVGASENLMRGQALYQQKCGACHSIDYNGVGPAHQEIFNRKAGRVSDYNYSVAVKTSTIIGSETTLDKWLTDPEKLIPGQKKGFLVESKFSPFSSLI